jgi:hypothetical protein
MELFATERRDRLGRRIASTSERFYKKVDKSGPIPEVRPELGPCWVWMAARCPGGYGMFFFQGKMSCAHIAGYILSGREIPEGKELDHLCRNRGCVNFNHLEPVSHKENNLRGVSPASLQSKQVLCKRGHLLDKSHKDRFGSIHRWCSICHNLVRRIKYGNRNTKTNWNFGSDTNPDAEED